MKNTLYDITNILNAVLQTDKILQIIQFVLAIVMALVGIAFKIWHWHKEAKADGKITKEEIDELIEDIKPEIDDIKNNIGKK